MSNFRKSIASALASWWFFGAVLVACAGLRVWHLVALSDLPLFDHLIIDSDYFDRWAQHLAGGDWLDRERGAFFADPLYPYVLGVIYSVAGRSLVAVHVVHVGLGVGTCALVGLIGRRVAGPVAGGLAAAVVAFYRPAIFEEGEVEKTALGVFLVALSLYLLSRRSTRAIIGAGVALGLTTLARGNAVLLIPFACVFVARRDGLKAAAMLAAGAIVALSPALVRNRVVSGEWTPTATTGGGQNLYLGHNPWNVTGEFRSPPWVRPQAGREEVDWRAEASRRSGRPLSSAESSTFWFREAVRYIAEDPARAAVVTAKKAVLLAADAELSDGWGIEFVARFSPPLRLPLLGMAFLFPLAVLGTAVSIRRREMWPVVGCAAVYAGSLTLFFIFSRYRLFVLPAAAVLAGVALAWLIDPRTPRARALAGLGGCVVLAWCSVQASSWVGLAPRDSSTNVANFAALYVDAGDLPAAERLLVAENAAHPGAPAVLCRLGEVQFRAGRALEAQSTLGACIRSHPTYPDAWYWLGVTYEALGMAPQAVMAYRQQLAIVPAHRYASERLSALGATAW